METADRIRTRMHELSLKSVDVTKAIGISSGGISQWLSGHTKPSGKHLLNLANLLGCDPAWLIFGTESNIENKRKPSQSVGSADIYEHDSPLHPDDVEVPFFEEVALAAGNGLSSMLDSATHTSRLSISMLERAGVSPSTVACCKVSGESMENVLKDGAKIAIDTSSITIKDGSIYAIEHGGMLRVKYLFRMPFGGLRIRSENSVDYEDEVIVGEIAKDIRVIGRVFWQESLL